MGYLDLCVQKWAMLAFMSTRMGVVLKILIYKPIFKGLVGG